MLQHQASTNPNTIPHTQEELRQAIQDIFEQHGVATGVYPDEDPAAFPDFCLQLQSCMARSPRTLLRKALDLIAKEMNIQELCLMLSLPKASSVHEIQKAVEQLKQGKLFSRVQRIRSSLAPPLDVSIIRQEITKSMCLKRKNKQQATLLLHVDRTTTFLNDEDDSSILEAAVDRAVQKDQQRRRQWKQQLTQLEVELEHDTEYQRYIRAQDLFQQSGLEHLWKNYRCIDLAICRARTKRGSRLEKHGAVECFDLIKTKLIQQYPDSFHDANLFSFRQHLFWWHNRQHAGEIDLAVLCSGQLVAICEMKSSCFDITVAIRQHESKIADLVSKENGNEKDKSWSVGPTAEESLGIFQNEKVTAPWLYFATLLPDLDEWMLGVEPLLQKAVCDGIRHQGRCLADESTDELCRPLISILQQTGGVEENVIVKKAMKYLKSVPAPSSEDVGGSTMESNNSLNYDQLYSFVQKQMEPHRLIESPAACRKRTHDRVLVVSSRNE